MSQVKLSAIDKATKHFQSQLTKELEKFHCEEWGLDIFYTKIHSLKTESKIVELAQAGKSVEALVQTVISKALDSNGKPLFTQYDKDALMNECDPAVVLKISRVLSGGDLPEVSEIEKN